MHPLICIASTAQQDSYGGYMVAFAGRKYAARSLPAFVANSTFTITSFTLVSKQAFCKFLAALWSNFVLKKFTMNPDIFDTGTRIQKG